MPSHRRDATFDISPEVRWLSRELFFQILFELRPAAFRELRAIAESSRVLTEQRLQETIEEWLHFEVLPDQRQAPWRTLSVRGNRFRRPILWPTDWTRLAVRALSKNSKMSAKRLVFEVGRIYQKARQVPASSEIATPANCRWLVRYLLGESYLQIASTSSSSVETVRNRVRELANLMVLPMRERRGRPRKNR